MIMIVHDHDEREYVSGTDAVKTLVNVWKVHVGGSAVQHACSKVIHKQTAIVKAASGLALSL